MRVQTTRVILACLVVTVATAVVARADCPSLKQLATQEYEEKVESESIDRNSEIGELKAEIASLDAELQAVAAGGIRADQADLVRADIEGRRADLQPKLDREQMEFRHWRESEALSHQHRLEEIDLEAAVSETAGLCLSMDELLRRCDVHARHRHEVEELRHRQAVDETKRRRVALSARLPGLGIDDQHTVQKENQEHADKLAMVELTCTQQKEIIRARYGQCPYSEAKLQYLHEWQRMHLQHRSKMELARLQHESDLLRMESDPYEDKAAIDLEKLRYRHTVALETLRYENDLKQSDPDLRWKVTSGRLDAATLWVLKQADAQRQREEEMLRHAQALEELDTCDLAGPLDAGIDTDSLAYIRIKLARDKENLRHERDVQEENALHRRNLRKIEAICPPRSSADCQCSH